MNGEERQEDARIERLHDYLDGLLSDDDARAVEEELERDTELRAECEALRALLDEAAHLPKSIAPSRDLWVGIERRIADQPRKRSRVVVGAWLATAAAVLLTVMVAGDAWKRPRQDTGPPVIVTIGPPPAPVDQGDFRFAVNEYRQARETLAAAFLERRDTLSSETVSVVESNLAIIAEAIAEIETALQSAPDNGTLQELLVAAYRKEVDLLQETTELIEVL